ncbi:protein ABHD13 [Condylostylus longicornis]|uniref:protein ABHD13 n=1 Tax=Condylostylus longicornis TaxID=2530218 RepID=UPI00244DE307|nr:protein ABHD13 [Condylostylus longicornis]
MLGEDWKITKVLSGIAKRLWAGAGAAILITFVFYCFYGALIAFSLFGFAVLAILYNAQDHLLYHPELPSNSRIYVPIPTMHNLPHETISIKTTDKITLHAFWIRQPEERSKFVPTVIYFHGNAGNMGHRLQNVWGIYYNLHCNILMVEYRGYGLSTGSPTEKGLCNDARAAVDYLYTRDDLDNSQIILFGRSLGGAVVIDVVSDYAYHNRIKAMIVENTFTNIPEMALRLLHPYVKYIPTLFYKNQYNSLKKIKSVTMPCLFISGLADTLVPPRMMRQLYNDCESKKKRLIELSGGSHNDTWICAGYYQAIANFLDMCRNEPCQKAPEKVDVWKNVQEV